MLNRVFSHGTSPSHIALRDPGGVPDGAAKLQRSPTAARTRGAIRDGGRRASRQTTTQPGEISFTIGLSFCGVYDDLRDGDVMFAEFDTLVEHLKFQRSTGQVVPEVTDYAGLQSELEAFRAAEQTRVRQRFYSARVSD